MTSYPSPRSNPPALTDETTLTAAINGWSEHLPLEMTGDYSPQDLVEILPFRLPAVIQGKSEGTRQLLVGRTSDATRYTLRSSHWGSVTCQKRVVCNDYKGFKGE